MIIEGKGVYLGKVIPYSENESYMLIFIVAFHTSERLKQS